jgi:hypothetical protein
VSNRNSVEELFRNVLRDEDRFESNLAAWKKRWEPFSTWQSDWQSAKSLEALIQVYARAATREALVAFVCLCLRSLTKGRGAIGALAAVLEIAERWSRAEVAREDIESAIQHARREMAGTTTRSPRRRYALAAAESMVRAATMPNKRGHVRYEAQAASAIACVAYAAGTKGREKMTATMIALFHSQARCPSLEEVLLREQLVRAELAAT